MASTFSPDEAQRFVRDLEIDAPLALRAFGEAGAEPTGFAPGQADSNQAVVIGSQIAEFAANVPPDLRLHISNSFLLAQLAAKKAIEGSGGGTREWFERYVEVLTSIGWVGEGIAEGAHEVSGDALQAHQAVIAVVTSALGPTAAAASIVIAALNGLKEMSEDSPWITLFDRQSQTKTVQQFQITYAHADDGAAPEIVLACFELSASASVTQILFFKFLSSDAKLNHRQANLSMNESIFEAVKDVVNEKIADHVSGLIHAIDI